MTGSSEVEAASGEPGGRIMLTDGRSLAFERWGRPGGRPVVWIGGNPGSRLSRHPDPDFYDRHGLEAVTFDRPGYGRSTRLPGRRVIDTVGDVGELLDAVGWDRCAIVGLSGGGAHALACGAHLPGRVAAIAVAGSPSPPAETPGWEQDLLEVNRRSLELVRHDRSALDHQLRATADRIREDPTEAIAGMMDDGPPPDAALLRRDDVVAMLVESMREAFASSHHGWFDDTVAVNSDWGFSLGEIEVPVLVFHGELDRNAPTSQARTLVAELPHAELTVFPDLGHISLLDRADDIVAQLFDIAA